MREWLHTLIDWFRPEYIGEEPDLASRPAPPPTLRIEASVGGMVSEVHRAPNGLYRFEEWTMEVDDEVDGPYLSLAFKSGLYGTLADAGRDARLMLSWLRHLPSPPPTTPSRVDAPPGAA